MIDIYIHIYNNDNNSERSALMAYADWDKIDNINYLDEPKDNKIVCQCAIYLAAQEGGEFCDVS